MSDSPEHPLVARRVPGWPQRWLILLRLHDYLLADALVLLGFWVLSRRAFWQYVMRVEESRRLREAILKGSACSRQPPMPERGGWRTG
jgi:hypothetical protein